MTRHVVDIICPLGPELLLEVVLDLPELCGLDEHSLFRLGDVWGLSSDYPPFDTDVDYSYLDFSGVPEQADSWESAES